MKVILRIFEKITGVLPYLFVFIASLYVPSDPDLGWHLKYGEYFFRHGEILRTNTFSTMMPDFQWANGNWGTDVLTYAIYHPGGFAGLTIVAAVVVTLTCFFFAKAARMGTADKVILFPLLVYLEFPLNSVSFRGQEISIMMTGIMCLILSRYKFCSKILLFLPLLFLIWANIHEQFFLALAILGVWMGVTVIRNHFVYKGYHKTVYKEAGYFIFIFLFCFGVTFINPFGAGVHVDVFLHFGNPLLKDITEYLPFALLSQPWWVQIFMGILVILGILFLYFSGGLLRQLPIMCAAFLLLGFSFDVRRYAWTAYYLIIPILLPLAVFLEPNRERNKLYFAFVISIFSLLFIIYFKWPYSSYIATNWETYCKSDSTGCSPASAEYLRQHPEFTRNIISLYGWGGWLIWNYPEIKPSIDGRMHLWVDENGYSGFAEYYDYEQNAEDIDKSEYDAVYMPQNKPIYQQMTALVEAGKWRKVYSDNQAGIFAREKNTLRK